jgi:hypothetical protein
MYTCVGIVAASCLESVRSDVFEPNSWIVRNDERRRYTMHEDDCWIFGGRALRF